MTSRDFCFWLQGFFEVSEADNLSTAQTDTLKNHLSMVFVHEIDPSMGDQDVQDKLNALHGPRGPAGPAGPAGPPGRPAHPGIGGLHGDTLIRC